MTSEISIKNLEIADDTELRKQEIKIGTSWIQTPIKSINPEKLYSKKDFPNKNVVIEVFKKIKPEMLQNLFENKQKEMNFSNRINNLSMRGGESNPLFLILQYDSLKYPNEEETEQLSRLSHTFSDIAPIPSIPKMMRGDNLKISNFEEFTKYIKNSISILKQINSKPILGYVPPIPILLVEKLINTYIDEGINSFYFDLDGTLITSHLLQIDAMKRKLKERGYEENHFIHYVNSKYGSNVINNTNIIPAQDIIGFIRGLDSFGGVHVSARRPPEYYEWLKKNKNIEENVIRLFDKEGYGYYKFLLENKNEIRKMYPSDSVIPFEEIDFSKQHVTKRVSEIVNMQQQILEAKNISDTIHEEPKNTAKYFQNKKFLNNTTILRKLLGKAKK